MLRYSDRIREKFGVNKLVCVRPQLRPFSPAAAEEKKTRNDVDTDLYVRYAKCKRTALTRGFHSARLEQLIVEQTRASASIQARRSLALYIPFAAFARK